jgi:hypothetical protein
MTFMERVVPVVDETIRALSKVKFVEDPIAGIRYSRATSIISSAYKRHGRILEFALRESLSESNRHKVWNDAAHRSRRRAPMRCCHGSKPATCAARTRKSALCAGATQRPMRFWLVLTVPAGALCR